MVVRYATTPRFEEARTRRSDPTGITEDFTARVDLTGLPAGQRIFYEVRFETRSGETSEPVTGAFSTPARVAARFKLVWGGDTAGQGWGIDPSRGGMQIYESMRRLEPDLFVHSGDNIYADGPIAPAVTLDDGSVWRNVVNEDVETVAETLRQFRGRYRYNLIDEHVRRFNAEVPMIAQWDDHEVLNNWYPGRASGRRGRRRPLRREGRGHAGPACQPGVHGIRADPPRSARSTARVSPATRSDPLPTSSSLDCRSYRARNSANRQPQSGP